MTDKVKSEDFIKAFGNGAKEDNKWIIIRSPLSEETVVKCPYCGDEFIGNDVEDYNFCPICGKQLKGGAKS